MWTFGLLSLESGNPSAYVLKFSPWHNKCLCPRPGKLFWVPPCGKNRGREAKCTGEGFIFHNGWRSHLDFLFRLLLPRLWRLWPPPPDPREGFEDIRTGAGCCDACAAMPFSERKPCFFCSADINQVLILRHALGDQWIS